MRHKIVIPWIADLDEPIFWDDESGEITGTNPDLIARINRIVDAATEAVSGNDISRFQRLFFPLPRHNPPDFIGAMIMAGFNPGKRGDPGMVMLLPPEMEGILPRSEPMVIPSGFDPKTCIVN